MIIRTFTPSRAFGLALIILATAGACISPGARMEGDDRRAATVVVENGNFQDVNVYAVHGCQRIRLGTVTGNTTRTLNVPRTLVGSGVLVRFLADFIGSTRAPVSQELMIWPGDSVELLIPAT